MMRAVTWRRREARLLAKAREDVARREEREAAAGRDAEEREEADFNYCNV